MVISSIYRQNSAIDGLFYFLPEWDKMAREARLFPAWVNEFIQPSDFDRYLSINKKVREGSIAIRLERNIIETKRP